jgi:hypothetical protein
MKNKYKNILIIIALINGVATSSASIIQPGMIDDFEDGTTQSWIKGIEIPKASILPPKNIANADESNRYLQVQSLGRRIADPGARDAHSRMVVFNETDWAGDYTGITSINAMMKATSTTEDYLYMRLAIFDEDVSGIPQSRYVSSDPQLLKTDGNWHPVSLTLATEDLTRFRGQKNAEDVLKNVSHLRFLSSKDQAAAWQVDKIQATLGIDDITAMVGSMPRAAETIPDVSAVPLPASVWLMISGIVGLIGMSPFKRQIQ